MSPKARTQGAGVALVPLLRGQRRLIVIVVIFSLLAAGTSLAQPLVVNRLLTVLGEEEVGGWVAVLLALLLLSSVLAALQKYTLTLAAERAVLELRTRISQHMIRLPMRDYDTHHTGDLVTRLSTDTTVVRNVFTGGLVEAVGSAFLFIGAIIAMAVLDPLMLGIVLGVASTGVTVIAVASRRIRTSTLAAQDAVGKLAARMERALFAIRTVKATRAEDEMEDSIVADAVTARDQGIRIARTEAVLSPISGMVIQAALLIVIGVGGTRVASGAMTLADLVTFVLFLFMLVSPLGRVFTSLVTVRSAQGAMTRINRLMEAPSETEDETSHTPGCYEPAHTPTLEVADVSFSYEEGEAVLEDVSFRAEPGSTLAIVGPSGSGKSTLLSLIERFYEPDEGRILLDGHNIAGLKRATLREHIAYVEQSPAILSGPLGENLRLGLGEATDSACWEALEKVNLRQRFERAQGLDTVLGERGANLSGGEKQRLALARALLSSARLLLLDEPTSAVDSENEQAIQTALASLGGDRTVIIVAHRLATVQRADRIVVVEDGRVRAVGGHDELLRASDLYRTLARRQFVREA